MCTPGVAHVQKRQLKSCERVFGGQKSQNFLASGGGGALPPRPPVFTSKFNPGFLLTTQTLASACYGPKPVPHNHHSRVLSLQCERAPASNEASLSFRVARRLCACTDHRGSEAGTPGPCVPCAMAVACRACGQLAAATFPARWAVPKLRSSRLD